MGLEDIVKVTITKQTTGISRIGFGTPLIMSTEAFVDSKFVETAKIYKNITELQSAGDDYDLNGHPGCVRRTSDRRASRRAS